jgi:hypothetical protein
MDEETKVAALSSEQERALACVLDEVVPASSDGRLPGAGELGLAGSVLERAGEMIEVIVRGLAALDGLAGQRGAPGFAALPQPERVRVLEEHASREPAFLMGLVPHTYVGYYQDARIVAALGLEPRPPYPQGYELEPGDLGLLDRVRQRRKLYREC